MPKANNAIPWRSRTAQKDCGSETCSRFLAILMSYGFGPGPNESRIRSESITDPVRMSFERMNHRISLAPVL